MAARIGDVLYWLGSLLAASMVALCVYVYFDVETKDQTIILYIPFLVCAGLFWLAGKALRYIFSGR